MELSTLDRLLLLGLLPGEGSITTLRIVRQLREELSFSEQEHADLKIVTSEGRITWDDKNETKKDVAFGLKATNLIVEALRHMNDTKKLTPQHIGLYEMFVEKQE